MVFRSEQEFNKIKNKNKNIRMYNPWSSLTDGGLYHVHGLRCITIIVIVATFALNDWTGI